MLKDFLILLIFPADVILQGFDEDEPAGDDCAEGLGGRTLSITQFLTQQITIIVYQIFKRRSLFKKHCCVYVSGEI